MASAMSVSTSGTVCRDTSSVTRVSSPHTASLLISWDASITIWCVRTPTLQLQGLSSHRFALCFTVPLLRGQHSNPRMKRLAIHSFICSLAAVATSVVRCRPRCDWARRMKERTDKFDHFDGAARRDGLALSELVQVRPARYLSCLGLSDQRTAG